MFCLALTAVCASLLLPLGAAHTTDHDRPAVNGRHAAHAPPQATARSRPPRPLLTTPQTAMAADANNVFSQMLYQRGHNATTPSPNHPSTPPSLLQDEIGSIQREVALLRECNHPNIVKYYVSQTHLEALHRAFGLTGLTGILQWLNK